MDSYLAWVLAAVVCVAVVLIAAGYGAARRALRSGSGQMVVAAATSVAVAVMCFVFFGQAMRHFGGAREVGQGGTAYRCATWWEQIGSEHGRRDHGPGHAPACRAAALDAVPGIIVWSGGAGVLGLACSAALLQFWRRRTSAQGGQERASAGAARQ